MSDLRAGRVLNGKYRVDRILGKGGMGFVVEAFHLSLECRVAVKVLHAELRTNQELVDRFLREGKCAARIAHEGVAKVFDVDRLEDGTPFLVMEYLVGHDLSVVRKSKTPLPPAEAIDYLLQACAAISEAHAQGIIHRDIKPANLFLTRGRTGKPTIKLLDFGISKLSSSDPLSEVGSTKSSVVMGSAEYMSPEQMLATKDADHRTDIWALGVVLFELLTARVPFSGETLTQVCMKLMSQPPERLSMLRPDLVGGGDLERVVLRCLEKDRDRRYASVDELASALEACRAAPERASFAETRAAATQPIPFVPPPQPAAAHAGPLGAPPLAHAGPPHPYATQMLAANAPAHGQFAAQPANVDLANSSPYHAPPLERSATPPVTTSSPGVGPIGMTGPPMPSPALTGANPGAAAATNPSWGGTNGGSQSPVKRSSRVPVVIGLAMLAAVGVTAGVTRPWASRESAATRSATIATANGETDTSLEKDSRHDDHAPEPAEPTESAVTPAPTPSGSEEAATGAATTPDETTAKPPASADPPVAVVKPGPAHGRAPQSPTTSPTTPTPPVASTPSSKTPRTMY